MQHKINAILKAATLVTLLFVSINVQAQMLAGPQLLKALQQGGNVIVMRHASSPRTAPDKASAAPGNVSLERQLDVAGRNAATAMGKALRELKIPVGTVMSSPAFRALETALYAQVPEPKAYSELGDAGQSMQPASPGQSNWLQQLTQNLPVGSNTLIITHTPNLTAAYPQFATDLADGEALIFGKNSRGNFALLARIKIEDWPKLGK